MNKLKLILSCFILMINIVSCQAQTHTNDPNGIQWMSFEEAMKLNQTKPKKIFIDVYTEWCGWCKRMDATTFKDSAVVKYFKENYYAVKLDAETKDSLHYKDKSYGFRPEYKANELAVALLNGQMGYPSFVFMDEQTNLLTPLSGYKTVPELMPILKFFGTDAYKTTKWEDFVKAQ